MDFFQHQDDARRRTGRLVALFVVGVVGVAVAVHVAVTLVFLYGADGGGARGAALWFEPRRLAAVVGGVLVFVALAAAYRGATVARSGRSVAEHLGARLVARGTTDPDERRLLNVVEEMAIAASLPVPPVYVVEEPTINAFAAGRTPQDAVLGFTRGALAALDRDELQGVVAHEFSHVVHGDMRLNLRLMAWIFGIAALGQVGEVVLRSGVRGSSRRGKDGGGGAIVVLALALVVVGGVGYFVGRLIQAAVSRQREFLADAAAVQFTRNPDGIAGALAKIERLGSGLTSPRAGEVRHLMFGSSGASLSALSATHPPIAERLARLGRGHLRGTRELPRRALDQLEETRRREADRAAVASGFIASLAEARQRLGSLPADLADAARDPLGAAAVALALLRARDVAGVARQDAALAAWPEVRRELARLEDAALRLPALERLPLLDLAIPALCEMSPAQFERFDAAVSGFVGADGRLEPFEWALSEVLRARLHPRFGRRVEPAREVEPRAVAAEARAVLSWIAHVSGARADAPGSHRRGANVLRAAGLVVLAGDEPLEPSLCASRLARHADRLRGLAPSARRALLSACETVARHDGRLRAEEAELLRALAEVLGVPTQLAADGGANASAPSAGSQAEEPRAR